MDLNATAYKKYHESFMANNHGTSALHTFFCIFYTVKCSLYIAITPLNSHINPYVLEYLIIVLPMILGHTILSDYFYVLNLVITILILCRLKTHRKDLSIYKTLSAPNYYYTKRIHLISILRGLTYMITVFCILAVDFQSFPRHLAKTEKYGYSLMDTGVGLFALMSGLVHKDLHKYSFTAVCKTNSKFIIVLFMLGFARYFSIKQLDYQEHVTEYGVHWNFFYTLAVCKILATLVLYVVNQPFIFSVIIIALHEFLLYSGLKNWVFSDIPRTNFLNANREGISSSLGYVALYLFAVHIKNVLKIKPVIRQGVVLILSTESLILWILLSLVDYNRPISRTLANAGYFIFLTGTMVTIVGILYIFEGLFQDKDKNLSFNVPIILSAVNENGLIYFLVANLLTGAINLSIKTLFASTGLTFVILNAYMIITTTLAVYLKKKDLRIE